jgi:hypothetical protein
VSLLTSGDVRAVDKAARVYWPEAPQFEPALK